jgi:hypothetical protein
LKTSKKDSPKKIGFNGLNKRRMLNLEINYQQKKSNHGPHPILHFSLVIVFPVVNMIIFKFNSKWIWYCLLLRIDVLLGHHSLGD